MLPDNSIQIPDDYIKVLDKGYVGLADVMGSDMSVVAAARVSYDKVPRRDELSDRDVGLIKFLAREGHESPFRHATLTFEIYAPLMVARQWWKYVVASSHITNMLSHNESSRRYITEEPVFHIPDDDKWRRAPENSKQGSGEHFNEGFGMHWSRRLEEFVACAETIYDKALEAGIAPEQARLFLPAYGMYVRWRWTTSLQGVLHFLDQRLAHDAQKEIQVYAEAVSDLIQPHFPVTFEAWTER